MNCGKFQRWISAQADGELAHRRAARLQSHLAGCPACRDFAAQVAALGARVRARPVAGCPTPEAAWADIRRALRTGASATAAADAVSPWWALAPVRWGAALGLVLLLALGGGLWLHEGSAPAPSSGPPSPLATEVHRVTTGLADSTTMVYEDVESGWTVIWVLPSESLDDART